MGTESQLGEAFVPIRATLDKLDGDLKQARSKVEGAMKGMEDKSGKAGGALSTLGTQVTNLKNQVPGLGAAFNLLTNPIALTTVGMGALVAISKKEIALTVEYNKQVREMMQLTGLGAEETSRIIQVADDWQLEIGMVRSALELMNKRGITPSIDNLAKIADEYVNATDKSAFMEEATKKYGKSFGDLIPILAKGGDELRKQTDAVDKNMIATDKSIESSRRLEVVTDNLSDSMQGLGYAFANELIPPLADAIELVNNIIGNMLEEESAHITLKKALDAGVISQKEYNKAMWSLRLGTDAYKDMVVKATAELRINAAAEDRLREARLRHSGVLGDETIAVGAAADAQARENEQLRIIEDELLLEQYTRQMEEAETAAERLAVSQETATRYMGRLNEYINGTLGPNEEKFIGTQGELNTKMGEIQGEIDKAIKDGYNPLGEKVLDLKGKYADLKTQYDDNAAAHEEDTKRIILGILAQEMAAMGFSDSTAFAKIAMKWGLIDEATMNAMMATDKAINWLRDHPGDRAGFEAMMNGIYLDVGEVTKEADNAALALEKITGQHEVGINITVTGDAMPNIPVGYGKPGEPYIEMATGFEGMVRKPTLFLAGESGEEYVSVIPQMKLRRADIFGGAGMEMAGNQNQLQPVMGPVTINLYATPEDEMKMRRQARYIVEEIKRSGS